MTWRKRPNFVGEHAQNEDRYAFEKFPRGSLALHSSRRRFWSDLITAMQIAVGESQGGRAYSLADLGKWSDSQLASIVPVILPGTQILVQNSFVWGRSPKGSQPLQLFPLESPALAVYNRFNGQTRLSDNARCLELETGWEAQRCFAYVRGLFLWLVLARVCAPKG